MRFLRPSLLLIALTGSGPFAAPLEMSYGEHHRTITAADLAALPRVEVDQDDHGTLRHYSGVAVRDVLALVDAPLAHETLRGPASSQLVRAKAADNYVVVFSLAEFSAAHRVRDILLVDQQDGAPLPDGIGPWRLICSCGARSVRQLLSLEIIPAP